MHIAFLTPEYPHTASTTSGGLGTSIKNLAFSLVKEGVEVSLIIYGQKTNKTFKEDGIQFYILEQKNYKVGGWYFYRKYLQNFLNELSKNKNIDIVEAADWTGITAFMNLKVPLVIRFHGSDAYFCALEGRKQKRKNRWFESIALKNADHLISVSEFTGNKTAEIFRLNKDFAVIPNGVNLEKFEVGNENIHADQLLYFGSVIRKKGVLELASIFNILVKSHPEAKLWIAGKDVIDIQEKESTVKLFRSRLSEDALQNFSYLGEIDYEQMNSYLSKAAVVVLPSFAEAFPMTWLEAMAMEKAMVTSNIGWAQEIMKDGETGFIENPEAHKEYADKILRLLENVDLRKEMGLNAKRRVSSEFSSGIVGTRNISFYKSVIKQFRN